MGEPASTLAWLAANPPPDAAFKQSLAGVARRALADEPPLTGDARHDAYLGALGEHFALRFGIERPPWVTRPERFLDRFWFKSEVPGFRAIAIAQSPAAFRRRGIFIAAGALQRYRCGVLALAEEVFGDRLDPAARFFVEELFAT